MKSLSFRKVRKILKQHDSDFEFYTRKGKGSHRAIEHPDQDGVRKALIIPCHNEGADLLKVYLKLIINRFNLPKDIFD